MFRNFLFFVFVFLSFLCFLKQFLLWAIRAEVGLLSMDDNVQHTPAKT
jgi:hypothetical protein